MADPEVLHTNPNVPQDEDGTGSEALFAGLNDEHALIVEARTLVGNSEPVDGLAEAIHPIPPLYIPPGSRQLVIDETVVATRDYVDAAIAVLAAQVAANTSAITTNTNAIAANTAAIASNASAIATLVSQVSTLQTLVAANSLAIQALRDSIKPSSYIPQLVGSWTGAGSLTVAPRLLGVVASLPPLAGAGSLTVTAINAKFIAASFGGEGSLSVRFTGAPMPVFAGWAGAGALQVNLTPIRQIYSQLAGSGNLTAGLLALLAPTAQFAGAGSLSVSIQAPTKYIALQPMAGAGALSAAALQRMTAVAGFAGAGALTVPMRALLPMSVSPLVGAGSFNASATQTLAAATTLPGTGSLSVATTALMDSGVRALAGAGAVSPVLAQLLLDASTVNLAGAGGLGVDLRRYSYLVVALAGAGALNSDAMIVRGILPAALAGEGSLAPVALQQLLAGGAGVTGGGTLTAIANLLFGSGAINLAGSGLLLPTVTSQLVAKPAPLAGAGAFAPVVVRKLLPAPPPFAGRGTLIVNATTQSSFSALDPVNSDPSISLSNSNRTAAYTGATGYAIAKGTKNLTAGKKYFEITITAINTAGTYVIGGGLVNSSWTNAGGGFDAVGSSTNSYGLAVTGGAWNYAYNDANVGSGGFLTASIATGAPAVNDTIMIAVDLGTGEIWMGVNNAWQNGFSPNSGAGTGVVVATLAKNSYPAVTISNYTATDRVTINVGNAAFKYTLPSGYSAWG